MAAVGKKLRRSTWNSGGKHVRLLHWCPGCDEVHGFIIEGGKPGSSWTFNGNYETPSFEPSMRISDRDGTTCHYFLRTGAEIMAANRPGIGPLDPNKSYIDFCGDSPHALANKVVELPDWPYAPGTFGGIEDADPE